MIPPKLAPLLLLVLECNFLPTTVRGQVSRAQPVNLVVQIDGQLKVKRPGRAIYTPVVFGTKLYNGDLLDLEKSSTAGVVCSDLTLRQVPSGIAAVPCPASRVVLKQQDGTQIMATRGPGDGSLPVVLSPRKTRLITAHPTLRWTPVKGATAYKVVVQGKNVDWSTVVTSATELVYPQQAPQLEADTDYRVMVMANGQAGDEPGLGLSFSLLKSDEKKVVLQEQKQIESLGLPKGPTQFLIAHLYADHALYAEAIEQLDGVSKRFKVAAVRRLLGDLQMDIGLPQQAEADYLDALELAKAENDDEGQMLLHQGLATIYAYSLNNRKMAEQHLNAMLDLAKKLRDSETANLAGKRLAELKTLPHTE